MPTHSPGPQRGETDMRPIMTVQSFPGARRVQGAKLEFEFQLCMGRRRIRQAAIDTWGIIIQFANNPLENLGLLSA
jgi:hypothetical protein